MAVMNKHTSQAPGSDADRRPPSEPLMRDAEDGSQRLTRPVVAALVLILAAAAGLRFYHLGSESLWYDELIMATLTSGPWTEVWRETLEARPPAYPILSWLWTHIAGTSEAGLRSLSAVLGTASVAMIFIVGRRFFDTRVAIVAALLMAFSPYQIRYSQEHRYYALVVLASLLLLWLLHKGLRSGRPVWFFGFAAAGALLLFSQYMNLLIFLAVVVAVALTRRQWGRPLSRAFWLCVPLALLAALVPMLSQLMGLFARAGYLDNPQVKYVWWAKPPDLVSPIRTVGNYMFLSFGSLQPVAVAAGGLLILTGIAVAFICDRASLRRRLVQTWQRATAGRLPETQLLLAAFGLPIIGLLAVSWLIQPIYVDRYLIASTSPLYLLVAAAVVAARPLIRPVFATAAILVVMLGSAWHYYAQPSKGDWRGVAAFLDSRLQPGDRLLHTSERGDTWENYYVGVGIHWYLQQEPEGVAVDVAQPADALLDELAAVISPQARTWLVMWDDPERDRPVREHLQQAPATALQLAAVHEFEVLTVFELTPPTPAPSAAVDR